MNRQEVAPDARRRVLPSTLGLLLFLGASAAVTAQAAAELENRFSRARALEAAGRVAQALAAYDALVELAPNDWRLLVARGGARFRTGDVAGSIVDFDRVIELEPTQEPYLWQRGISLYYARRFEDCARQFELHRTVNPADVENAAWHFLCQVGASSVDLAREMILPVGRDARPPMMEVYELFSGRASVDFVLAAAAGVEESRREWAEFYAWLYIGLYFEAVGLPQRALEEIEKAVALELEGYMPDVARVHLQQRRPAAN